MFETPEQRARREIDANLTAAGWIVQNRDELDLTAGRGIAVNNFSPRVADQCSTFPGLKLWLTGSHSLRSFAPD
jgi:hypothetical protein